MLGLLESCGVWILDARVIRIMWGLDPIDARISRIMWVWIL